MSAGTVPILGTDGQVHSIPQDQASVALAAGGKPVAQMRDPSGQARWVPSDQVQTAQQNGGKVLDAAPSDEELQFLQQNPNHQWMPSSPRFPNRPAGIYPTGPGNEWRNDPSSAQTPVDLHLGLHSYQGAKAGLMAATLPLALGATVPQIAGTVIGGVAGGYAGQKIAKEAGAGPVGQEISSDVGGLIGGAYGARGMGISGFIENLKTGLNPPVYPGAPQPAVPAPEVWQARGLSRGATVPPPEPSAGLGQIPNRGQVSNPPSYPGAPQPFAPSPEILQAGALRQGGAAPPPEPSAALGQIGSPRPATTAPPSTLPNPSPEASATIPRTLHGEGALSEVLSHLDQPSLLKIAKSRGINVTQESLLKPGTANNLLIRKIVNNFSPATYRNLDRATWKAPDSNTSFPIR